MVFLFHLTPFCPTQFNKFKKKEKSDSVLFEFWVEQKPKKTDKVGQKNGIGWDKIFIYTPKKKTGIIPGLQCTGCYYLSS